MVVENSFGSLKRCWRCLQKRMVYYRSKHVHVIAACIMLHNICQARGESCDPAWAYHEDCLLVSHAPSTTTSHPACAIYDALYEWVVFSGSSNDVYRKDCVIERCWGRKPREVRL